MRFKYRPPISDWAVGRRQMLCKASAFYFKPEYPPRVTESMNDLRWYRDCRKFNKKHHRTAVGTIRAMGAQHFFRGCYHGAEND